MAAMLDQSLDAMIKETRKATPKARKANAKKTGNKTPIGGKKKIGGLKNRSTGATPMAMDIGGGVKKGGKNRKPMRSNAATAMAIDSARRGVNGNARIAVGGKTKLMVGNLDFKVNDRDIKELFSQVGRVLSAGVNYGPNGKSKGTAEVTLATLDSAMKAVSTYNGVKLDGRPLQIVIVDAPQNKQSAKPITHRLSGLKQQPTKNGKQQQKPGNRGAATAKVVAATKKTAPKKKAPKKKAPKKEDAPKPTAADLDASLDAYKASADVQMAA